MNADKVLETLRKARGILPLVTDEKQKSAILSIIRGMETSLKLLEISNTISPTLRESFLSISDAVEDWYDKIATN